MTASTLHAIHRTFERVGAELGQAAAERAAELADRFAATCGPTESVAVRLGSVRFIGQAWADDSNGDTLVAIIRGRAVVTVMFRRSTQPFTPEALRTDRVAERPTIATGNLSRNSGKVES